MLAAWLDFNNFLSSSFSLILGVVVVAGGDGLVASIWFVDSKTVCSDALDIDRSKDDADDDNDDDPPDGVNDDDDDDDDNGDVEFP